MELDLPLLRRRLVNRESFSVSTGLPVPSMCAFLLFDWEAQEIVGRLERLERAEREMVEAQGEALGLMVAVGEALNALDENMPLLAGTILLKATSS